MKLSDLLARADRITAAIHRRRAAREAWRRSIASRVR